MGTPLLLLYRLFLILTLVSSNAAALTNSQALSDRELRKIQEISPQSPKLKQKLGQLKTLAQKDPNNLEVRLGIAKLHLSMNEIGEALAILKTINFDIEPRALLLTEKAQELKGDQQERIRLLELLRLKYSESEYLLLRLGDAYWLAKNTSKAVETLKTVIKKYPKRRSAYFELLDIYDKTKNNYENRILLSDMAEVFKTDPIVHTRLCKAYATNSFLEQGIEICTRAISLDPTVAENHVYLGLLKKYFKQVVQGERIIRKAAQQFPKSELAQFTAGQLNDEQKNFEAARRSYKACVATNKKSTRCWLGLAQACFQIRDYKQSLAAFENACKIEPTTARIEFRNAVTQLRLKKELEQAEIFSKRYEFCGSD